MSDSLYLDNDDSDCGCEDWVEFKTWEEETISRFAQQLCAEHDRQDAYYKPRVIFDTNGIAHIDDGEKPSND